MTTPQNNTPLELLDKRAQLLASILSIQQKQQNTNRENIEFLAKWLTAILDDKESKLIICQIFQLPQHYLPL